MERISLFQTAFDWLLFCHLFSSVPGQTKPQMGYYFQALRSVLLLVNPYALPRRLALPSQKSNQAQVLDANH